MPIQEEDGIRRAHTEIWLCFWKRTNMFCGQKKIKKILYKCERSFCELQTEKLFLLLFAFHRSINSWPNVFFFINNTKRLGKKN